MNNANIRWSIQATSAPTRSQRPIRAIIALPVIATTFVMYAMVGRRSRQLKMPRPDAYAAMNNAANLPSADELRLPRLSDDAAVEIHRFLKQIFDLFEARYGDQITRFYDSMSRDNLFKSEGDPQPGDPPF